MNNEKLNTIIHTLSDDIEGDLGQWRFSVDSVSFYCITDVLHNRMRIISPIADIQNVSAEQMQKCLEANFHTALDIKYAISEGVMWATFIHPLKELTDNQVVSAITQVYSGVMTFGTYYSSGSLSFPTSDQRKSSQN